MSRPGRTRVALATAAGTLTDLEEALREAGHPVVRFDTVRYSAVLDAKRISELRRTPWDGILVSSPRGLDLFLEPVFGHGKAGERRPVAYVAGESTALGAERLGFEVVRPSGPVGPDAMARSVPSGRSLRLLHPRSDVAGPAVARRLRGEGHTVRDVVAFRTVRAVTMSRSLQAGFRRAGLVVVSSPTALTVLRRQLGREAFRTLAATVPFRVLGAMTQAAARRAGIRHLALLDPGPGQRFTRASVGSLFDGRSSSG